MKDFKISKRLVVWMFIICALIFLISFVAAENISPRYKNTYSIETSKLHMYKYVYVYYIKIKKNYEV